MNVSAMYRASAERPSLAERADLRNDGSADRAGQVPSCRYMAASGQMGKCRP